MLNGQALIPKQINYKRFWSIKIEEKESLKNYLGFNRAQKRAARAQSNKSPSIKK